MKNGVNFTGVEVKGWTCGLNPPYPLLRYPIRCCVTLSVVALPYMTSRWLACHDVIMCNVLLPCVLFYDAVRYKVFLVMLVWPYMSPRPNNNSCVWPNILRYIMAR